MDIDEVSKKVVSELNNLNEKNNSILRAIGVVVFNRINEFDLKKQRKIIVTIKKSSELKLSPQMVYDAYRMVRTFPDLASDKFSLPKNITISHMFEASRFKFSPEALKLVMEDVSENAWSISRMKEEIRAAKSAIPISMKERLDKLKIIREKLKPLTNEQLIDVIKFIGTL